MNLHLRNLLIILRTIYAKLRIIFNQLFKDFYPKKIILNNNVTFSNLKITKKKKYILNVGTYMNSLKDHL